MIFEKIAGTSFWYQIVERVSPPTQLLHLYSIFRSDEH